MRASTLLLFFALNANSADWPQWRGPNRDGISAETGLLPSWPQGGPPVVWKANGLGVGYSSLAIVNGRIYTQGQRGRQEFVFAFDAKTGKKIWETPTSRDYRNDRGDGPRGTPTIDGDRLYAMTGDGVLVCLEVATGKMRLVAEPGPKIRRLDPRLGIQRIASDRRRPPHRHARRPRRVPGFAQQARRQPAMENRQRPRRLFVGDCRERRRRAPGDRAERRIRHRSPGRQRRAAVALHQSFQPHRQYRHADLSRWRSFPFQRLWHRLRAAAAGTEERCRKSTSPAT